jgi:hypothetical protein
MAPPQGKPILQLRVALTARDYEQLLAFYSAGLGVEPAQSWSNDGGRAVLLELGKAALEIFDEAQAQAIDRIEVGRRVSGEVRFAHGGRPHPVRVAGRGPCGLTGRARWSDVAD